ncbi:MAG TPA: carboxypeptidase-like regulatory domain-containing protein, partial [Dongiaceae bacterium]|nr:carboxypeptidase-like regulatory domain-containing protein [Dongiaceae bacterium]
MPSLKRVLAGACAAWLLAGAAIVATAGDAPPAGRVRGAITGADKKPLSGRLVTLRLIGGAGELRVTSTDERGQYQFRELPPGMYEVRVEADGYEPGVKGGLEV